MLHIAGTNVSEYKNPIKHLTDERCFMGLKSEKLALNL